MTVEREEKPGKCPEVFPERLGGRKVGCDDRAGELCRRDSDHKRLLGGYEGAR